MHVPDRAPEPEGATQRHQAGHQPVGEGAVDRLGDEHVGDIGGVGALGRDDQRVVPQLPQQAQQQATVLATAKGEHVAAGGLVQANLGGVR